MLYGLYYKKLHYLFFSFVETQNFASLQITHRLLPIKKCIFAAKILYLTCLLSGL